MIHCSFYEADPVKPPSLFLLSDLSRLQWARTFHTNAAAGVQQAPQHFFAAATVVPLAAPVAAAKKLHVLLTLVHVLPGMMTRASLADWRLRLAGRKPRPDGLRQPSIRVRRI